MHEDFEITIIGTEKTEKNKTETEEQELTLEQLLALPHPLEQFPVLLDLVDTYFPDKGYRKLLLECSKPSISDAPDEMEEWEAEVILRRKQPLEIEQFTGQPGIPYLIRLLYEETYSVRQFQGSKNGSEGITLGGLLSHHYFGDSTDGVSINTIAELDLPYQTFEEAFLMLAAQDDYKTFEKLVTLVTEIGFPKRYFLPGHSFRMRQNLLRNKKYIKSDVMENMGYRMVKIINENQELLDKIDEKNFNSLIKFPFDATFIQALYYMWGQLSKRLFNDGGYYKTEITTELLEALEMLILLRTNPQNQILYKYLSPSGYINSQKTKETQQNS